MIWVNNISLETPLGVTDLSGKPIQPEIYPNPSSGIVTVSLQGIDIETVNVYSSIGSMVYHQNNLLANNIKIDLSSAEKGFYFVELLDKNGQSYSSKIVIE